MNKSQSKRLGEIFVKYNKYQIDDNTAIHEVFKIFPRICDKAWIDTELKKA